MRIPQGLKPCQEGGDFIAALKALRHPKSGAIDDVSWHDLFCGLGGRVSSAVSGGDAWWGFSRPYGTRLELGNFSRR
jgi:hypothetical protein